MAGEGKLMEITMTGGLNGQFVQNVLHGQWEPEGEPDPFLNALSVAGGVVAEWLDDWLPCLPESYVMSSIRVRQLEPASGPTYTQTSGVAGETGARAAEISVYTSGPLINMPVTFTNVAVGKIFLPGVAESDIAYGILESSLVTVLDALILALLTPLTISGSYPGTLTYCVAKTDHSDWKVPLAGYISPTIGTQRRRAKPNY